MEMSNDELLNSLQQIGTDALAFAQNKAFIKSIFCKIRH